MDKLELGKTGIMVSRLGLGTVKFGRNQGVKYPSGFELPDENFLADFLSLAKSLGINTLDTAPSYGASEERLGRLLKGQRQDWIIIGKAGEEFENGQSTYNFTPDYFKSSLERSLQRLNTNYLDVLLIHSDGRDLEILQNDALIKTLHEFRELGLVRAIGASTKTPEGGLKALDLLDIAMVTHTAEYSDEKPVLDKALQLNKGIILKKSLGSGHTQDIEKALNFAFMHPAVQSAIVGTISPQNLRQNIEIVNKIKFY